MTCERGQAREIMWLLVQCAPHYWCSWRGLPGHGGLSGRRERRLRFDPAKQEAAGTQPIPGQSPTIWRRSSRRLTWGGVRRAPWPPRIAVALPFLGHEIFSSFPGFIAHAVFALGLRGEPGVTPWPRISLNLASVRCLPGYALLATTGCAAGAVSRGPRPRHRGPYCARPYISAWSAAGGWAGAVRPLRPHKLGSVSAEPQIDRVVGPAFSTPDDPGGT